MLHNYLAFIVNMTGRYTYLPILYLPYFRPCSKEADDYVVALLLILCTAYTIVIMTYLTVIEGQTELQSYCCTANICDTT